MLEAVASQDHDHAIHFLKKLFFLSEYLGELRQVCQTERDIHVIFRVCLFYNEPHHVQRCQPLRFWRNHYAFLPPTMLLRRNAKSLRFSRDFLLILHFVAWNYLLVCPTTMYLVSLESSLKM